MAQFNASDPRYMRELQEAAARNSMGGQGRRLIQPMVGGIAGRHAGYQLGLQNQFHSLALANQRAQMQHDQSMAGLAQQGKRTGLGEQQLGFNRGSLKDWIKDQKSSLKWGIGTGLAGMGMSFLEGRKRKAATAAETLKKNQFLDRYLAATKSSKNRRTGATDEGALMAERFWKGGTL